MNARPSHDLRLNAKAGFAGAAALVTVLLSLLIVPAAGARPGDEPAHEVWAIDQSDTTADGGGTVHIYRGDALAGRSNGSVSTSDHRP